MFISLSKLFGRCRPIHRRCRAVSTVRTLHSASESPTPRRGSRRDAVAREYCSKRGDEGPHPSVFLYTFVYNKSFGDADSCGSRAFFKVGLYTERADCDAADLVHRGVRSFRRVQAAPFQITIRSQGLYSIRFRESFMFTTPAKMAYRGRQNAT